jgi:hypothetical protein
MDENVGGNALRLAGEIFVPGASQLVSGNIGAGLTHNLLAGAAGVALIGTGVAPVLGAVAVLAIKLNSYSSAVSGRNLWDVGSDAMRRRHEDVTPARSGGRTSPATA